MGVTNQGLDSTLTLIFPVSPAWYIGLINNTPAPVLDPTDTLASHAGWVEIAFTVGYSGNRKLWTNGAASGNVITNASFVAFSILATETVYGILLCASATSNSSAVVLFGTAPFVGGPQAVVSGDTLNVTLTVSAASS